MKTSNENNPTLTAKEAARLTKVASVNNEKSRRIELRKLAREEMKNITFRQIREAARKECFSLLYNFVHPDPDVRREIISQLESLGYKCKPFLVVGPANYAQNITIDWNP